jgi:hypothetical protein
MANRIDISASASSVSQEENIRLRLALVEEVVRYQGPNRIRLHHHVVRALPGGADGVLVKNQEVTQKASVDLEELRKSLNQYLDDYSQQAPFPNPKRPLNFGRMFVVAFLQNDSNREILQAKQVELGPG